MEVRVREASRAALTQPARGPRERGTRTEDSQERTWGSCGPHAKESVLGGASPGTGSVPRCSSSGGTSTHLALPAHSGGHLQPQAPGLGGMVCLQHRLRLGSVVLGPWPVPRPHKMAQVSGSRRGQSVLLTRGGPCGPSRHFVCGNAGDGAGGHRTRPPQRASAEGRSPPALPPGTPWPCRRGAHTGVSGSPLAELSPGRKLRPAPLTGCGRWRQTPWD